MELSLISFIGLLVVCSAALIIKKVMTTEMKTDPKHPFVRCTRGMAIAVASVIGPLLFALPTNAQSHQGGEANLILPDLAGVKFFGGVDGHTLLLTGLIVCVLGLVFGMAIYMNL